MAFFSGMRQAAFLLFLWLALCSLLEPCQAMACLPAYTPEMPRTKLTETEQARSKEMRKAVGSRIKELRKNKGWTQKELAQQVEIPFSVLNKYESGFNMPPVEKLVRLTDVLQTSVDFLLTGDQSDSNPIYNNRLIDRIRAIQEFSPNEQETALSLLDALILKHEVSGRVSRFEA